MKQLLDQFIEAKYKSNTFFSKRPIRPNPRGPASADELRRLDAHLSSKGLQAPDSYKACLAVYNGIENLFGRRYSLLSIDEIVGKQYELLEENEEEYPNLGAFVIGAGETSYFMGFDTSTPVTGKGYELAEITDKGAQWRFKSFEDFLTGMVADLEKTIRDEEQDRKNLKP